MGVHVYDLGFGNGFLDVHQKYKQLKKEIHKLNLVKLKTFLL